VGEGGAVVEHDLDVIGALGDAGVDERLGLGGGGEGGDGEAVLGAVAAGCGGEDAGAAEVGEGGAVLAVGEPSAAALRMLGRVNMSSSVVTPNARAWRRASVAWMWVWASMRPGRRVMPVPSTCSRASEVGRSAMMRRTSPSLISTVTG
jgi:hypothetical protein